MSEETIPQVTVLSGNDAIGREKAKERLLTRLRGMHLEFSVERHDEAHESFDEFMTRSMTASLFEQVRLFSIGHVEMLAEEELECLGKTLDMEIPDVYFLIEVGDFDERRGKQSPVAKLKLSSLARKDPARVALLKFSTPPDYKLGAWLVGQVPEVFGRRINKVDAEHLIDLVGKEVATLYSELQKIDIYLPDGAPIDSRAIDNTIGASRTMTPFELAEALGKKDLPRALEIVDALFTSGFYAPPHVAVMFRHFWALVKIRAYTVENPGIVRSYMRAVYGEKMKLGYEIGCAVGLMSPGNAVGMAYPVIVKPGIVEQARQFSDAYLGRILSLLLDFDVDTKTGRLKPVKLDLQLLCYRIVRVAELWDDGGVR